MRRGAIESLLGKGLRVQNGSANGGAGGTGFNIEAAAELGHAFAHAWNADAKACSIGLGLPIGGQNNAAAVVNDLEDEGRGGFKKPDCGGNATGMALDVGEAFLNDAEESDFQGLRKTAELIGKDELGFDAAALAEAVDVLLESGDEAKFIEQGGVEEVREGADLTRRLLEEGASFFEGAFGGCAEARGGLADLGEAQVDGQNSLRHAIVEFATDAATLFVLKVEQLHGELANGLLGVLHLGDIGKGRDDAEDGAIKIELRDGVAENPEDFRRAGTLPAHGAVVDRVPGAEDGGDRTVVRRHDAALLIDWGEAQRAHVVADHFRFCVAKHFQGGLIGEFDFAVRVVEDNGDVEVAYQGTETLLAFTESIESFALLGDVGGRYEDTREVASGIEFRNHVRNGPKDVTNVGTAPTEHLTIEGLSGGDNGEKRISGLWNGSAVFLQRLHGDFVGFLMQDVFERESKHIHGGPIGELQLGLRIEGDQADVEVADESAETLFAFPESVEGLALLGEIGDGNDNAGDFACGVKFRDGVQKGPSNARRGAAAHADNLAANRLFGGQDDGNGTGLGRQLGAVLAKSEETEFIGGFAEELFILAAKRVLDGLIGKEDAN